MARRQIYWTEFGTLLSGALANGARRKTLTTTTWDISGDCQDSYHTEIYARPDIPDGWRSRNYGPGLGGLQVLEIQTRCRSCERCLRARARRWYGAALSETQTSTRTWFGTLTLNPSEHFAALVRGQNEMRARGVDPNTLNGDEEFLLRHREIGKEITRYLKRVRKASGAELRYLLICEAHVSGLPHYHILVHERMGRGTVTHRVLSTKWLVGFEKFRLVDTGDPRVPRYLTKYLTKTLKARVRASKGYGRVSNDTRAYAIEELDKVLRDGTSLFLKNRSIF